jgi:pyruvate kinase
MNRSHHFSKKTKIIATLGPASISLTCVKSMIQAGVDVFRINASHSVESESLRNVIRLVREASRGVDRQIGIFLDLQGPKIRIGSFSTDFVKIKTGQKFQLTTEKIVGDETRVSVSYDGFYKDVKVGDPLFINDGMIRLKVEAKRAKVVHCKVMVGGILSSRKGVNLPNTHIGLSPVTEKDYADAKVAVEEGVDYIALSFVSLPSDVTLLRTFLNQVGGKEVKIIAKIERQLAVDHISEIVDIADAVMVARGDLGVEIGVEHVPRVQKMIISESNRHLKPVIVATQMLESMITSTTATRAEVSDVANAIYDRCDAVMLSGETAVGVNPVNVVKTMREICQAADDDMVQQRRKLGVSHLVFAHPSRATSICQAADQIAEENHATAILAFTSSGNTPLISSKLNSSFPILSPTDEEYVCKRTSLYRGVIPMMMPRKFSEISRWTEMIQLAIEEAKSLGYVKPKDVLVVTAGIPIGISNGINSIRVVTVE